MTQTCQTHHCCSPQGGRPPPPPASRTVRLPGREVNPQRARLWQELGTDSPLFDVTLRAADREVPCNRCGARSQLWRGVARALPSFDMCRVTEGH